MPIWWPGLADAPPDEAQALHALGLSFMAARTLHVALELRLFTHLAAGARTHIRVTQALGLAERAAGRLLYACTALGLVQATGGVFRNTPLTQKYLVEGQPTFIGSYLQMFDALSYHRWEQMSAALRHNGRWTISPIPIAILPMMQRTPQGFPRRSMLAHAASGMRSHAGSISHLLRVSSTWEVVLGRIRWQSCIAIHTCAPSSSIFPR